MISSKRTNQGGSVRMFLIVAVILAIVTIGTASYVQKHGEQARRNQAIAQANKQAITDKAATDTASTNADKSTTSGNDATQTATSSTSGTTEMAQTSTVTSADAARQQSSVLPTTGADMSVVRILMVGLLAGFIVAYISSRREQTRPL